MAKIKLVDLYTVVHRGVKITVQERPGNAFSQTDYGYKTATNITGIGQSSAREAEADARAAIDEMNPE